MTATEVDAYFQSYADAFSKFDVEAVGRLWAFPAYMVGRGKREVFGKEEFHANTKQLCKFYKLQGMVKAQKQVLELHRLTDTTATVRTADTIVDKDGVTIAKWEHVYVLSTTDDGIKAVTAFPDQELAAWEARGTRLGSW